MTTVKSEALSQVTTGAAITETSVTSYPTSSEPPSWSSYSTITTAIGLVGILGNVFTIVVICSSKTLRKKTVNMFLINQSAIDFMASLSLVASAHVQINEIVPDGALGIWYCKLWGSKMPQWTFLASSTGDVAFSSFPVETSSEKRNLVAFILNGWMCQRSLVSPFLQCRASW